MPTTSLVTVAEVLRLDELEEMLLEKSTVQGVGAVTDTELLDYESLLWKVDGRPPLFVHSRNGCLAAVIIKTKE